jgi:hypothetical protein
VSISTSRRIDSMRLGRAAAAQHAPAALFFPSFGGWAWRRRHACQLVFNRGVDSFDDTSSGVGLCAQRFGGARRVVERVILAALGSCPARPLVRQVCGLGAAPPAFDDCAAGALCAEAPTARAPAQYRDGPRTRHVGEPARRSRRIAAKDGCVVLGYRRDGCMAPFHARARNECNAAASIDCSEPAQTYRGRGRRAASASRPQLPSRVARQRDRTPDARAAAPGPVGSCSRTPSAGSRVDRGPQSTISNAASRVDRGPHSRISSAASRVARTTHPERSRR